MCSKGTRLGTDSRALSVRHGGWNNNFWVYVFTTIASDLPLVSRVLTYLNHTWRVSISYAFIVRHNSWTKIRPRLCDALVRYYCSYHYLGIFTFSSLSKSKNHVTRQNALMFKTLSHKNIMWSISESTTRRSPK